MKDFTVFHAKCKDIYLVLSIKNLINELGHLKILKYFNEISFPTVKHFVLFTNMYFLYKDISIRHFCILGHKKFYAPNIIF